MPTSKINTRRTVMVLIVAAAAVILCSSVPLAEVSPGDHRLRGLLRPSKTVELTAPVEGNVAELNVQEMLQVKEGTLLARIDDELQKIVIEGAKLDALRQKGVLDEVENDYQATVELKAKDAANPTEVRRAKAKRDAQDKAYQSAEGQVKLEERKLERYAIKAPFDGEVMRIMCEKGARLSHSDKAFVFVKRDPMEAHMFLPDELITQLKVGQVYAFEAEAPIHKPLQGTLKTVEANIEPGSKSFRAVFTIANPDLKLPGGVKVKLVWPQPKATASAE